MNLTDDRLRFLQILSDGKKKTYVHAVKGFGMPLKPMAPTFTNNLARSLLKMKRVKHADGGYKITAAGRAALAETS